MFSIRYDDHEGTTDPENENEDDYLVFKALFDQEQLDNHYSVISQEITIWKEVLEDVIREERLNNEHIWKFNYWVFRYLEDFNKRKLHLMSTISQLNEYLAKIDALSIAPINEDEMERFRLKLIDCINWLIIINQKEEKYMVSKFHPSHSELNIQLLQISSRIDYLRQIVSVLKLGGRFPEDKSNN